MNIKQLRKIMKPTEKKAKMVYLVSYIENEDSVTITYKFKNQKDSHLKVSNEIWKGMEFKKTDVGISITNLNGLHVTTNESGWSRLVVDIEDSEDE